MKIGVDYAKSRLVGRALAGVLNRIEVDTFEDQRFYPPPFASREEISIYFLVMVALDHRLSRPGRPYEGYVDGEFFHGADLLYRLGRKIFDEDPEFYSASRLKRVTRNDILEMFSVEKPNGGRVSPPDPDVRASLLRDLGDKLERLYGGSAYALVVESRGYLRKGVGEGFIDRLKVFAAYQDPVEKKPFLLAKFLERRGVLHVMDPYNKEVPVDNHLARIAVRTGMVIVDEEVLEKIAAKIPFSPEEDIMLRYAARTAYKIAAASGGIDPFIMDDLLWQFGRKCCTRERPICRHGCTRECTNIGGCTTTAQCILQPVCLAARDPRHMVSEHTFLDTWWY